MSFFMFTVIVGVFFGATVHFRHVLLTIVMMLIFAAESLLVCRQGVRLLIRGLQMRWHKEGDFDPKFRWLMLLIGAALILGCITIQIYVWAGEEADLQLQSAESHSTIHSHEKQIHNL